MVLELLIPVAIFLLFVGGGLLILASGGRERKTLMARLERIRADGAIEAAALPADPRPGLLTLMSRVGQIAAYGGASDKLQTTLARAGYGQRNAAEIFFGVKIVAMVVGLGIAGALVYMTDVGLAMGFLLAIAGGAGASILPNMVLTQRVNARTAQIRRALPNAIDLLEVCVTAGMGLDQAWNATAEEIREAGPALGDEMSLVNLEMLLGAKRSEALQNMAERTGAEELASLSSIIVQADRFGTSMADALRTFAETMRETRSQKAEETAEKMAIKMMLPMVIFIFPVVLLITGGPAAIKTMELFSN